MSSIEDSSRNNSVSSQASISDTSLSYGMGLEMEVIIDNREDRSEEQVESQLPKREGYW